MSDLISLCSISSEHKKLVVCWITSLSTTNKFKWVSWNSVWSFITFSSRIIDKQLYSLWQSSMQSHGRISIYSPDLRFCRDTKQMIENWFYIETRKFWPWSKTMGSVRSKTHNHQRRDFCFAIVFWFLLQILDFFYRQLILMPVTYMCAHRI